MESLSHRARSVIGTGRRHPVRVDPESQEQVVGEQRQTISALSPDFLDQIIPNRQLFIWIQLRILINYLKYYVAGHYLQNIPIAFKNEPFRRPSGICCMHSTAFQCYHSTQVRISELMRRCSCPSSTVSPIVANPTALKQSRMHLRYTAGESDPCPSANDIH